MSEAVIRPATSAERRVALRLSLAVPQLTGSELEHQVNGFIDHCRALNINYERQYLALSAGRPVAACTCIAWPGRTGMLMLGPGRTPALKATLVNLIDYTVRSSAGDGIKLFQALPMPDDAAVESALLGAGFSNLAVLHYLEKSVDLLDTPASSLLRGLNAADLALETYDERNEADWRNLILKTYDESLDCPGLSGLRDMDDILAGHRGAGLYAPHHWLMLRYRGQPAGVMMLTAQPMRPALEIAYTGVLPALRGRRLGQFLVSKALSLAVEEGFSAVTLAVDERNRPARAIYDAAGFVFTGARRAMIRPHATPTL